MCVCTGPPTVKLKYRIEEFSPSGHRVRVKLFSSLGPVTRLRYVLLGGRVMTLQSLAGATAAAHAPFPPGRRESLSILSPLLTLNFLIITSRPSFFPVGSVRI